MGSPRRRLVVLVLVLGLFGGGLATGLPSGPAQAMRGQDCGPGWVVETPPLTSAAGGTGTADAGTGRSSPSDRPPPVAVPPPRAAVTSDRGGMSRPAAPSRLHGDSPDGEDADHGPHLARPAPHAALPARRVVHAPHLRRGPRPAPRHGAQHAGPAHRPPLRDLPGALEEARPDAEGAGRDGRPPSRSAAPGAWTSATGRPPTGASTRSRCATSRGGGTATSTPTWSARSWPTPRP